MLISVTAIISIVIYITLFCFEKNRLSWSPLFIISIATIIRILFIFRQPELSDDIYRYLWDGVQLLCGNNPYSLPPESLTTCDKEILNIIQKINHPQLVSIYPPFSQILFGVAALFGKTIISIKILFVFFDIITCLIIIKILKRLNLPLSNSVLYAWHPLPVLEIAGSGHVDSLAIFFLTLSLFLIFHGKSDKTFNEDFKMLLSGVAFGCAFMIKVFPIVFLPIFLFAFDKKERLCFITGFLFISIFLLFLFSPDVINMFKTLSLYLSNWEFSNYAFNLLRDFSSSNKVARIILLLIFLGISSFIYILFISKKNNYNKIITSIYWITMAFLLSNPTLHPWYVLYIVFLLPFYLRIEGIVFSWAIFLLYYIQIEYFITGKWIESALFRGIVWSIPIITMIVHRIINLLVNFYKGELRGRQSIKS